MHRTDRTASAAIAAGLLVSTSVVAELVHPIQEPDGTVLEPGTWVAYLIPFVVGAALLVRAAAGVGGPTRAGRIGRGLNVTGAALVLVTGLVLLPTGALGGTPPDWAFIPFALGLLASVAGCLTLGIALRNAPLLVAAAGALVALALQPPAHDVGLLVFLLSWSALGLLRLRHGARAETVTA